MTSYTHGPIRRRQGVAGQVEYEVEVTYEGEPPTPLRFVGSTYGGPIVMVLPSGAQTFVREPERFGQVLSTEWVANFLAKTPQ